MGKIIDIGVLVSGSGSNLQSLIDHIENGKLDARIKIVITNNPKAYALERCRKHRIPFTIIDHREFSTREEFDREIIRILESSNVELVVLAGFMRILSSEFIRSNPLRIMNIHPALLPAFPGTHVQEKAIEYGAKFAGCTVHFVDEGVDSGPILIQAVVPVYDDDTADTLAARILREEHRIYPQAIQYYAEGKFQIEGRKVHVISGCRPAEKALHNPPLTRF